MNISDKFGKENVVTLERLLLFALFAALLGLF